MRIAKHMRNFSCLTILHIVAYINLRMRNFYTSVNYLLRMFNESGSDLVRQRVAATQK